MHHLKAERPAIALTMKRAAEADHLGRKIDFDATTSLPNFQASHVARRFGISSLRAEIIAPLAFGEARS